MNAHGDVAPASHHAAHDRDVVVTVLVWSECHDAKITGSRGQVGHGQDLNR